MSLDRPDYTLPISIEGIVIESLPVNIVAQTIATLKIDIVSQTLSELKVSITSSTVTLNVNIAECTATLNVNIVGCTAILNVNIASQTVDINIKTSSGANIIIDKLTQGAVTERRFTLENNSATGEQLTLAANKYYGKFFPRGCRGYIKQIHVYCGTPNAGGANLWVFITPHPTLGWLKDKVIGLEANSPMQWRSVDMNTFWDYDSLFIYIVTPYDATVTVGIDADPPYDYCESTDRAVWAVMDYRLWIKVSLMQATVGDLPVSGMVNTIMLPNTIAIFKEVTVFNIDGGYSYILLSSSATGRVVACQVCIEQSAGTVTPENIKLTWEIDGNVYEDTLNYYLNAVGWQTGISAPLTFGIIDTVNNKYMFALNFPIPFKRSIKLTVTNQTAAGNKITCHIFRCIEQLS